MTEQEGRDRVDAVAREWLGTPFHDNAEVKGRQGGVDCARLLKCVMTEAGLIDDFVLPNYSPQFYLHHDEQRFLGVVTRFAHEIEREKAKVGDVVLYWIGKCFAHGAIIINPGWPNIIHAHHASRCVVRGLGTSVRLGMPIRGIKFFSWW